MSIDFTALNARLLAQSESLLKQWQPEGRKVGNEWKCGDIHGAKGNSCSTNLATGTGADFATNQTWGDLVDLYAQIHGLSQIEAARRLDPDYKPNGSAHYSKPSNGAPPRPDVADAVALYRYTDTFYVARFEPEGQRKSFRPFTWDGSTWNMKAPATPRPLYGIQEALQRPECRVVIVEGEKSRDACARLLPDLVAVTWNGGASALGSADWGPLKGRDVIIWPDADEPGVTAGEQLAKMLYVTCRQVYLVNVAGMPDGWDCADAEVEGWTKGATLEWLTAHEQQIQAQKPPLTKKQLQERQRKEEAHAKRAAALTPITPVSMGSVIKGTYNPKTPLFEGILYPGAWLIVGRPKIGKSWLLLQLSLSMAYGGPFLGYPCQQPGSEVLMICAEDDYARIQGRLHALGHMTAPDNSFLLCFEQFIEVAKARSPYQTFAEFLDQYLSDHPMTRLIIVDTETTTRQIWCGEQTSGDDGRRITDTDYQQVRQIDAIGLKRGCCIALVNHAAKRKGEWLDIHELINRSNTAMAGATGSMVLADPQDSDSNDPNNKLRILGLRSRDMKDDLMLMVEQQKDMPQFQNLGAYHEVKQNQTETVILEAIEEIQTTDEFPGYVSIHDISELIGKKRDAIKQAMARLMKKPQGAYWKQWRIDAKRGRNGGFRLMKR